MSDQNRTNGSQGQDAPKAAEQSPPTFEQLEPIVLLNADFVSPPIEPDSYGQ